MIKKLTYIVNTFLHNIIELSLSEPFISKPFISVMLGQSSSVLLPYFFRCYRFLLWYRFSISVKVFGVDLVPKLLFKYLLDNTKIGVTSAVA